MRQGREKGKGRLERVWGRTAEIVGFRDRVNGEGQ